MTGDFFKFEKRCQFFIGVHNETLSVVAICVPIQIVRPLESKAATPGDFFLSPNFDIARLRRKR